jgi:hypothetical protein
VECVNEILIECVKALGGSKAVAPRLWPELLTDKAQRKLLDCLNPDREHRLSPEQSALVMRWARDAGYHDGWQAYCRLCGYYESSPMLQQDEKAELQKRVISAAAELKGILARLETMQ